MARVSMAFRCFFGLLLGGSLPKEASSYLPEEALAALPAPTEADSSAQQGDSKSPDKSSGKSGKSPDKSSGKSGKSPDKSSGKSPDKSSGKSSGKSPDKSSGKSPDKSSGKSGKGKSSSDDAAKPADAGRKPARAAASAAEQHQDGALAFLALLQREGRLVDFLQEDIDDYDDDDVGAAVRNIHRDLRKVLADHLTLEPVMPGEEGDDITVPKGFDAHEVRLSGEVDGNPPFKGTLQHHGWRVTKVALPTFSEGVDRRVLAPAEVEVP